MKLGLLGIGTELTTGQIQNKNAQYLSKKLYDLGFITHSQIACPDDRKIISDCLDFLSQNCDLIVITGGLGPTTDDFTREVVADWTQLKLEFDQASWQHLNNQLHSKNIPVREAHKQECYFPTGAIIYTNDFGTANGFSLNLNNLQHIDELKSYPAIVKKIVVLPGPPKEIDGIWENQLKKDLVSEYKIENPQVTLSWDTIGKGESEVANLVESVTENCPFELSYRVHLPYVEVKLSFHKLNQPKANKWIQSIDKVLQDVTITKNGVDIVDKLLQKCSRFNHIWIYDTVSQGVLLNRITPFVKTLLVKNKLTYSQYIDQNFERLGSEPNKELFTMVFSRNRQNVVQLELFIDWELKLKSSIHLNTSYNLSQERQLQLFSEYALIETEKFL